MSITITPFTKQQLLPQEEKLEVARKKSELFIGIPKEILQLLGELKYRTSYGQNVLKHSTEMAHMAGLIAEEIGADVRTTKIATLLHDVGKLILAMTSPAL